MSKDLLLFRICYQYTSDTCLPSSPSSNRNDRYGAMSVRLKLSE